MRALYEWLHKHPGPETINAVKLWLATLDVPKYRYTPYRPLEYAAVYKTDVSVEVKRDARTKQLPNTVTSDIWKFTLNVYNGRCAYCGRITRALQKDHVIPLASKHCPGTVPYNLIPACSVCNESKGAQDLATWHQATFGSPHKTRLVVEKLWRYQDLVVKRFPQQCKSRGGE